MGIEEDALELEDSAASLEKAVEETAWDGAWYRRAFFDDGTPLGSAVNDECRIDCISQSWAAISGKMERARVESAMQAVEKNLVSWEDGILRLLWPPFVNTPLEPGYIKGYLAGVRENGGQYTHGAIWAVWAYAQMGLGDMAWRLLYMLNPIQHGGTPMGKDRYKAEPYVLAADVYSMPPLAGRGGWTWYTGSAAWMYRVAVESLLGLCLRGDTLLISPCIPAIWREYTMEYHWGKTRYMIHVENARGVCSGVRQLIVDGRAILDKAVHLSADGETHTVHVLMGE
jgi:cellobiose phosphorylase